MPFAGSTATTLRTSWSKVLPEQMAASGCDVIRSTQDTEENKFIYTDLFNQYSATWPKEKGWLAFKQSVPVCDNMIRENR